MTDHIPDAGKKLVEVVARGMQTAEEWSTFWGHDDACKLAQAALRAIEAAGYRIVPVEPTEEMLKKGVHAFQHSYASEDTLADWRANYRAMLAAAPKVVP